MINTEELKKIIKEERRTYKEVASAAGMSYSSFYRKMKKGILGSDDIDAIVSFLNIKNPLHVFFVTE